MASGVEATPSPMLEGWLTQRGGTFKTAWKPRWLTLRTGRVSGDALEISSEMRSQKPNESLALVNIVSVKQVDNKQFGRPHCFVVEYSQTGFLHRGHQDVGFQAASDAERDKWVEAVGQAAIAAAKVEAELKKAKERQEANPKGKGKGKGPPLPSGEKGGGKGKVSQPPPPKAAGAKGQGKGFPTLDKFPKKRASLPLGQRLGLTDAGQLAPHTAREVGETSEAEEHSIFKDLLQERGTKVNEDVEVLKNVFKTPRPVPATSALASARLSARAQTKKSAVLSMKQAQNLAILLKGLPLQPAELAQAIESLKPGSLLTNVEGLERLADSLPGDAEMRCLSALREEDLLDVERNLLPLARIARLQQHLRVLCVIVKLECDEIQIAGQLQSVQAACSELRTSATLRAILAAVLVMFNYANFGSIRQDGAHAFDITTLLRLGEFKAAKGPFPNFNGFHFVVMRLLSENKSITATSLSQELKHLHEAASANLCDIQNAIKSIHKDAEFLQSERREHPVAYGGQEKVKPEPTNTEANTRTEAEAASSAMGSMVVPTDSQRNKRRSLVQNNKPQHAMFKKVRGWVRHRVGQAGNIKRQTQLPEASPPNDAPEPAWLLKGDPESGIWRKVWVETPAPGLLLCDESSAEKNETQEGHYVVIAGAEVLPVSSPFASLEARATAEEHPNAFELQNVVFQGRLNQFGGGARLWLDAESPAAAKCWSDALGALAAAPGAGFLFIQQRTGIWRSRWAVLHPGTNLFTWYRTPGEYLRGDQPVGGLALNPLMEIATFAAVSPQQAKRHPFGFKVSFSSNFEDMESIADSGGFTWNNSKSNLFCASSTLDMERWVGLLRKSLAANCTPTESFSTKPLEDVASFISSVDPGLDPPNADDACDDSLRKPGRKTSVATCSPSSTQRSDTDTEEEIDDELPIQQLHLMANRAESSACQLDQTLAATNLESRNLLKFFGQACKDASPLLFSQQVHSLFVTIKQFSAKLESAFMEVQKSSQAAKRRGQPDPTAAANNSRKGPSLFGFSKDSQPQMSARGFTMSRWHWQKQLAVKKVAKSAVESLIAKSFVQIYARWASERAIMKALQKAPT